MAFDDIALIDVVVTVDESPITAVISCNVLRTAGAVPIRSENWSRTSSFVNASIPLIVILLSSEVKLILVPGTMFLSYFQIK